MAKVIYIVGLSKPQSDDVAAVSTFWHIRKPRTRATTLCGAKIDRVVTTKTSKPKGKKELCGFCKRIVEGRHPVFGPASQAGHVRPEHRGPKGTTAHPDHLSYDSEVIG